MEIILRNAFKTESFPCFCLRPCWPKLLGETAEQPRSHDDWVCCDESVVSSWESLWPLFGQVRMPAALLEHSKLQTPIPLTHIINFQIAAQI